jgi:hypothetical protein
LRPPTSQNPFSGQEISIRKWFGGKCRLHRSKKTDSEGSGHKSEDLFGFAAAADDFEAIGSSLERTSTIEQLNSRNSELRNEADKCQLGKHPMSFGNGAVINARVRSILNQSRSGLDAFRVVSKLFDCIRRPAVQSFRIWLGKYAEGK